MLFNHDKKFNKKIIIVGDDFEIAQWFIEVFRDQCNCQVVSFRQGGFIFNKLNVIQVVSVDADTRPVNMIGQGSVTLFAIGSATVTASPSALVANGINTSTITITVRDRNGIMVPVGTPPVGLTTAPNLCAEHGRR